MKSFKEFMGDVVEATSPCWKNYKMLGMKKKGSKMVPNCIPEEVEEIFESSGTELYEDWDELEESAEKNGKSVKLNKPFLTPGGPKKRSVYVKNASGNVVKVNFGDPNMEIKRDNPERRKNYRARHNCSNPGPKWKANYWSCKYWSTTPVSKLD
jgi:hypothetical protein